MHIYTEKKVRGTHPTLAYQILNTDFYNYLGNLRLSIALRKQNKTDLALEVVNKMLFLYPTDVNFMVELGLLYEGEKEKAAAVFRDVIVLAPENVTAWLALKYYIITTGISYKQVKTHVQS
ncbi:MAG: hypothetical protein ABFS56_08930 [Pseudomonadota bacterium]